MNAKTKEDVLAFYDTLKKNGINCVIRREHGTDIDAACGQLRSKQIKRVGVRERMKQKQAADGRIIIQTIWFPFGDWIVFVYT